MQVWLELHSIFEDTPMMINMSTVKQITPNGAKANGAILYFGVKSDYEYVTVRETYEEIYICLGLGLRS